LEKGAEGTVHIQFYVNFKHPGQRISYLKKFCKRAHFESVKFNNGADKYCMKDDTRLEGPWEFGIRPIEKKVKADWERVRTLAKEGKLDEIPADIYCRMYGQLKHIQKDHLKIEKREGSKTCLWIHGDAGSGKTRHVHDTYPVIY